jgi:hypothetical protein
MPESKPNIACTRIKIKNILYSHVSDFIISFAFLIVMSRSQMTFTDDKDTIDFAKRFLNARIYSLDNDVKRCLIEDKNLQNQIGQPTPFPALLYCFSIIDNRPSL